MTPAYRVDRLENFHSLTAFDCGEQSYNDWLVRHATHSVAAGVCAVYLLIESSPELERVVGYYAINPTLVVRADAPGAMTRGWPASVPAWKLGKLAVHLDLRKDRDAQWGRQLLRQALETIINVADRGGGKVVVVDADNERLVSFYLRNGFIRVGADSLSLYLKISTVRKAFAVTSQ